MRKFDCFTSSERQRGDRATPGSAAGLAGDLLAAVFAERREELGLPPDAVHEPRPLGQHITSAGTPA